MSPNTISLWRAANPFLKMCFSQARMLPGTRNLHNFLPISMLNVIKQQLYATTQIEQPIMTDNLFTHRDSPCHLLSPDILISWWSIWATCSSVEPHTATGRTYGVQMSRAKDRQPLTSGFNRKRKDLHTFT